MAAYVLARGVQMNSDGFHGQLFCEQDDEHGAVAQHDVLASVQFNSALDSL